MTIGFNVLLRTTHVTEARRPVLSSLKSAGYDGWLTIEAFGRALPELAAATRVWRDFFPAPEQVWREGSTHIRTGWATS